ncbi:Metallo-dependent phosphatase-like protein, partial [Mycena olivaceomarginata]
IDRFREPLTQGLMCDILWLDPAKDIHAYAFPSSFHSPGTSFLLPRANSACNFLKRNKLLSIIRAHEAQDAGCVHHCSLVCCLCSHRYHKTKTTGFPSVMTIFSAPNYLDMYNNNKAVIKYENNVMNMRQFNYSPHPYWLPNFMDVFTWSLPFVGEKVGFLPLCGLHFADPLQGARGGRAHAHAHDTHVAGKVDAWCKIIGNKIMAVGCMSCVFAFLRSESERVSELKSVSGLSKLPYGSLAFGLDGIKNDITGFDDACISYSFSVSPPLSCSSLRC